MSLEPHPPLSQMLPGTDRSESPSEHLELLSPMGAVIEKDTGFLLWECDLPSGSPKDLYCNSICHPVLLANRTKLTSPGGHYSDFSHGKNDKDNSSAS